MMMMMVLKISVKDYEEGEYLKAVRDDVAHNNCSLCVRVLTCFHYHFHSHQYHVDHHHIISVSDNPPYMDITTTIFFIIINVSVDHDHWINDIDQIHLVPMILMILNMNIIINISICIIISFIITINVYDWSWSSKKIDQIIMATCPRSSPWFRWCQKPKWCRGWWRSWRSKVWFILMIIIAWVWWWPWRSKELLD